VHARISDTFPGLNSPLFQIPQRPHQLLMGGIQDKIISLDLEKVKEIQLLETGNILLQLLK
jgi:hypothetical protein